MAFQNNFPATPQPTHPIKRRPQYQKLKPTVLSTKTNSSGRNSQSSNPELPEEDIYARHLESSGDWARTPDGAAIYHWKGVMTGLLRRLHSKTCAMNLNALDGFGAECLIGATLALVDEGPTRGVIDDDRIKTMISGDSLDINRKHKPILTYKPMAKWIISANETPRFGSAGQAIERRFLFAPWTASLSVEQRIPNLEQKIFDLEAREVLDWVLQGALAVLMKKGFDKPDAAMRLKEESLESMDTVLGWKNLAQPVIVNCDTPKHLIYEDYREWCSMNGQVAVRSSTFWMRLLRHLGVSEAQVRGTKKLINQQRVLTVKMKIHQPDPSPQEDEKHPFDE